MSNQERLLMSSPLPPSSCDDSTAYPTAGPSNSLPVTTRFRSENAQPSQLSSSFKSLIVSNRLLLPHHQAQTLQSIGSQAQRQPSRPESLSIRALVLRDAISFSDKLSMSDHLNTSNVTSQRGTHVTQLASLQTKPKSSLRKTLTGPSLLSTKKSTHTVNRQRVTPFKSLRLDQLQRIFENSIKLNPFEKFAALEARLRSFLQDSELSDDWRRLELVTTIHRNVEMSLTVKMPGHQGWPLQHNLVPEMKNLGLGKVKVVEDQESCSFCVSEFQSDYGSSDETILLPASAGYHICLNCQPTHFFDDEFESIRFEGSRSVTVLEDVNRLNQKYGIVIKSPSENFYDVEVELSDKVLDVKWKLSRQIEIDWNFHHLVSAGTVLRDERSLSIYRIGPKSPIDIVELKWFDGRDVTQFRKPAFCQGCSWTQIDIKLAKICMLCVGQRYSIICHYRHTNWTPFFNTSKESHTTCGVSHKRGNCMICTSLAKMKCDGCPLLVCVNCSTFLDERCKGNLNLLIYHISHEHIRNDAFLLRSDGGGF